MTSVERRRIEELVVLYELEPKIRDVFVEGSLDRALIDWFLSESRVGSVTVHEIDSVDVPTELVESGGFAKNNRGRVLTLARELEVKLGRGAVSATCLIDADFDWILNETHDQQLLLSTDYTCMELYFFDVRPLTKFLQLVIQRFPKPADTVLAEIRKALSDLFAIRLANHVLAWNIPLVSFERCCKLTRDGVQLDVREYIDRCLHAGGRYATRAAFYDAFEHYLTLLKGDPRKYIHGHDFLTLLVWYIRQHRGQSIAQAVVERSLLTCAEVQVLQTETLFKRMLGRVAA